MAQATQVQSKSSSRRASSGTSHADHLTPARRVTAQISAMLGRGVLPILDLGRIKPWDDIALSDALVLPLRSCGTPYRGMNIIALWAAALESGFKARHWFTFNQALAMKACVRKGERGTYVVYYTELTDKAGDTKSPSIVPKPKVRMAKKLARPAFPLSSPASLLPSATAAIAPFIPNPPTSSKCQSAKPFAMAPII